MRCSARLVISHARQDLTTTWRRSFCATSRVAGLALRVSWPALCLASLTRPAPR